MEFGPKLLLSIVILIIGFWAVKRVGRLVNRSLNRAKVSPEISTFLGSMLDISLKFIILLIAAGVIGFQISSLVAILAAAGFAVGLALQGFLGNFASGITIVFFKPYKVGDWVEISDKFGQVESIQIFNTTLITPGQKTLIIPNGQVTDGIITNFSTRGHIHLELQVSIPYEESFPKVKPLILDALRSIPKILNDPEPIVGIEQFDTHNIILSVRPFIKPDDYWDVTFKAYSAIKKIFHENGIKVAYSEGIELGKIGN
ncbi:MAG: mechanosensitive ion channel family protein [Bacteroidetes bacterium]|nr:mechanosensitive ion channel family protein [Bacteroidota bacterium]